jgi:Tubulin binding cofactor A
MKHDPMRDKYDIKMFGQVVSESQMMVPDSKKRYEEAISDLSEFMLHSSSTLNMDGEWYHKAKEILDENGVTTSQTNTALDQSNNDIIESTNVDDLSPDEIF